MPSLFSPRIGLKPLVALCQRLAMATKAGIDDRKIWRDEAARSRGALRAVLEQVSDALARGDTVADALTETGDYFPKMFRQVVAIGDASGHLDRSYRRLGEHYGHMLAARRSLASALAWPMIQLGIAVMTIGAVIWVSAQFRLKTVDGEPLDLFGLGLTGTSGLMIYALLVGAAIFGAWLVVHAVQRGALWTRGAQKGALKLPGFGLALQTLAMARFTWALQLVLDTSMDLRKSLPLALEAAGNEAYRELGPRVARNIGQGMTLHMALDETGMFPGELLDAIAVGEESGMLAETMQRESVEYQRRAATAMSVIGQTLGYVVWVCVAVLIVVLIFRVFSTYVGQIEAATKM